PGRTQLQSAAELLMRFLRPIGTIGVVIVFTIYLLMKREDLRHRILLLAGMGRISVMTRALEDAAGRISQYLLFQAAVNAAYGTCFGFGLFLIGVPNAFLWGVLAAILRIVCIVVMGRYVPQLSFLHTLLGTDAELSADALFYERLLAMDQQEAHAVANRFLESKSLVELYDSVLIPALGLIEQDRHQG